MSSEWKVQTISSLGEFDRGKSKHRPRDSAHLYGGAYPFIQTGDVTNSGGRITSFRQTYSEAGLAQSRLWPAGTVVITIAANIAETAILTFPACFPDSVVGFTADPLKADVRFIEYLFQAMRKQVKSHAYGSAQENINLAVLRKLEFPIPPLRVQTEIADYLTVIDDRITLLRETNVTLEAIAQTLFKSWFVDFDPVRAKMEGRTPEGMDEATAALFPDSFEPSELGEIPSGWLVSKFEDFIQRLPVGKKFDQKSAEPIGNIPILDQGRSGIIGYHNESPGVVASLDEPVVVFANHTCYMRLISFNFSAIQNVLPFKGSGVDTVWAYYATQGRVKHSEYKGHWPDFAIEKSAVPSLALSCAFRDVMDPIVRQLRLNELQVETLSELRDTLLPRLISGQLRLPEAEKQATEALA